MKLHLIREPVQPNADCTLGILLVADLALSTIERPWIPSSTCKGGAKGLSCVPIGTYDLVLHDTPKHPRTFALVNFDLDVLHNEGDDHDPDIDRVACLIHPANFVNQIEGCIAPGLRHTKAPEGTLGGYMVVNSRDAFAKLMAVVPWALGHTLEITEGLK